MATIKSELIHSAEDTGTALTKSRLKKSSTSSVVDGPPMLRNTIAVGPLEPFTGVDVAVAKP